MTATPARGLARVRLRVADRFTLLRVLGVGQEGEVHLARDERQGGRVAVKLLREPARADPQAAGRLQREARLLGPLRHPHIVRIIDHGVDPALGPYLALEYLDGTDLKAWDGVDAARMVGWLLQACLALEHLHQQGIVHRDVKPENLRVLRGGGQDRVVLLDFGLAAHAQDGVAGTPQYLAPEVVQRLPVGPPADVYALGVILYHFLTGRLPFDGPHGVAVALMHVQAPLPPLQVRPELTVSAAVVEVVEVALAKAPEERFEDAGALGRALARAAGLRPASAELEVAASRIAAIAGAVVQRRHSEPPAPFGVSVEAVIEDHCEGDPVFARRLLSFLESGGALRRGSAGWRWLRPPRPQGWPGSLAALEALEGGLGPAASRLDEPAAEALLAAELSGEPLPEAVAREVAPAAVWEQLEALGGVARGAGGWQLSTPPLAEAARRRFGPALRARVAVRLATLLAADPATEALRLARLWGVGQAHGPAAEALARASDEAWADGDTGAALSLAEQALRQIRRAPALARRSGALRIWYARRLREAGRVEEAVQIAEAERLRAQGEGWPEVLGRAAWLLAEVDRDLQAFDAALAGFALAAAVFEGAADLEAAVDVRLEQARLLRGLGRPGEALEAFDGAWARLPAAEQGLRRAAVGLGLGEAALRASVPERGLAALEVAERLYGRQGRAALAARAAWLRGESLRVLGRLIQAGPALQAAVEGWRGAGDQLGEATGWIALARLARARGDRGAEARALRAAAACLEVVGQRERAAALRREAGELTPAPEAL